MKKFKALKIGFLAILGLGIAFSIQAQASFVETEQDPLFQEENIIPGQIIERWIKVSNDDDHERDFGLNFINVLDDHNLGEQFDLTISRMDDNQIVYQESFENLFLTNDVEFFDKIGANQERFYLLTVKFNSLAENQYQQSSLRFDILFALRGEGNGNGTETIVVGGFGGALPVGEFLIFEETIVSTEITDDSITIVWDTSYPGSSQVIYAQDGESHVLDLNDNIGFPPQYGYARTTPEYNIDPKVSNHVVTITGLLPNTTYYYRTVSRASFAISREHSFTTRRLGEIAGAADEQFFPQEDYSSEELISGSDEQSGLSLEIESEESGEGMNGEVIGQGEFIDIDDSGEPIEELDEGFEWGKVALIIVLGLILLIIVLLRPKDRQEREA
jgi:hypothetical protein